MKTLRQYYYILMVFFCYITLASGLITRSDRLFWGWKLALLIGHSFLCACFLAHCESVIMRRMRKELSDENN